ncbi:MAG: helix-turn-helix transcriptional regulator [Acutalibacteraceae bacterium]
MKVSYDKLWKILIDKKMKKYQLREQAHISSNSVAKLSKGEFVSMEVLLKICETLDCDIGDVCEFYKDDGETEKCIKQKNKYHTICNRLNPKTQR